MPGGLPDLLLCLPDCLLRLSNRLFGRLAGKVQRLGLILLPVRVLALAGFGGGLLSLGSLTAACMLAFSLLYTPCVAAIAAIRREMGGKWALGVVLWQCAVAWIVALVIRLIGMLF